MVLPSQVFGYIDPGVGSYFLQISLAFLFGSLYLVKVFWRNIVTFFKNLFAQKKQKDPTTKTDE